MQSSTLNDIDEGRAVIVPEASRHDINVWPHLYPAKLQEAMFPTAVAVPEVETVDPDALAEHARLHERYAATRITFTRG